MIEKIEEELKKQDLSNSKIRDKIRNRIKYLTEYYEKEVKPGVYHWEILQQKNIMQEL